MGDWCLALHMVEIPILIDGVSKCSEGLVTFANSTPQPVTCRVNIYKGTGVVSTGISGPAGRVSPK